MLTLEREELRRYSVWDQQELEELGLHCEGEEEPPLAAALLFCVSEVAAVAIQWDLRKLCVKQDGTTNTGETAESSQYTHGVSASNSYFKMFLGAVAFRMPSL